MTHHFFYCLLAPTWSLCMVCESACLLVYVTEKKKMYLHNKWTLEDFKRRQKMTFQKKKATPASSKLDGFSAALPVQTTQQDFVRTTPLRYIWYCFYWLLFPMSDFNMTRHLGHVWTVLKRNVLCQASATFTPSRQKSKGLLQRMFVFLRPLRVTKNNTKFKRLKRFRFGEKGHRRFDCHIHLGQFYIWHIYKTTVAQEQFSVYM